MPVECCCTGDGRTSISVLQNASSTPAVEEVVYNAPMVALREEMRASMIERRVRVPLCICLRSHATFTKSVSCCGSFVSKPGVGRDVSTSLFYISSARSSHSSHSKIPCC